jgi:hypothetical protein
MRKLEKYQKLTGHSAGLIIKQKVMVKTEKILYS